MFCENKQNKYDSWWSTFGGVYVSCVYATLILVRITVGDSVSVVVVWCLLTAKLTPLFVDLWWVQGKLWSDLYPWPSSTWHTLHYSSLQICCTKFSAVGSHAFSVFSWLSIHIKWPFPSSPTETLSRLLQIKPEHISFSKTIDLPCFLFHAPSSSASVCQFCIVSILVCAGACVCA